MSVIIFLGAGASASEGAPLQGDIFKSYAELLRNYGALSLQKNPYSHYVAVPAFFRSMFGIDMLRDDLKAIKFPTFEEALGVLDLALRRGESYGPRSYQAGNWPTAWPTTYQVRFILTEILALAIVSCASKTRGIHSRLVENIAKERELSEILFATTNYDLYVDSALQEIKTRSIDYGFTANAEPNLALGKIALFKVHGSINWLWCQTCFSIRQISESEVAQLEFGFKCARCEAFMHVLVVPPTFFKDMSNPILSFVWRRFAEELLGADHVIFCGYSFPDADMHVKYAFKRREVVCYKKPLRVTVVNDHKGKTARMKKEERERFERFLYARWTMPT